MGFGVNVLDCQQRPVLSMGAGIGFGFSSQNTRSSIYPALSSGIGGGGGITMQTFNGGSSQPSLVMNIGGGGGGGLLATNGVYTPDFGATPDVNQTAAASLSAAFSTLQASCTPLTVSSSGGGGGGFVAYSPVSTVGNMNYGGGSQFGIGAAYASGGGPVTNGGNGDGKAIGDVYKGCRVTCQAKVTPTAAPDAFWTCYCPCTKKALLGLGLQWAAVIVCPSS